MESSSIIPPQKSFPYSNAEHLTYLLIRSKEEYKKQRKKKSTSPASFQRPRVYDHKTRIPAFNHRFRGEMTQKVPIAPKGPEQEKVGNWANAVPFSSSLYSKKIQVDRQSRRHRRCGHVPSWRNGGQSRQKRVGRGRERVNTIHDQNARGSTGGKERVPSKTQRQY